MSGKRRNADVRRKIVVRLPDEDDRAYDERALETLRQRAAKAPKGQRRNRRHDLVVGVHLMLAQSLGKPSLMRRVRRCAFL